jgi:energy-coupling factor transport system ATP-binding protein
MNSVKPRRWAPLTGSLVLAGFFIVVRVFYRTVFGSFTLEAAGQAASAALPFAAVIVACGLASSLADVRRLLVNVSSVRVGRSIATALAIALAAIPSLASAASRLLYAFKLRGIRRRSAVLVPLLEHAVERSVALAAAMDMHGFGAARQEDGDGSGTVSLSAVTVSFDGLAVLSDVTLGAESGSVTVLTGPTGSGKTTFLEAISGLAQHFHGASVTGSVNVSGVDRARFSPRHTARLVGSVPQNVRLSFAGATVREELEFGLRVQGLRQADARARATAITERLHLTELLNQSIETLSAGQATRVAIASALMSEPRILLLDEPLADLDSASVAEVVNLLRELAGTDIIIIMAEHHTAALQALNPRWIAVEDGRVREGRWGYDAKGQLIHAVPARSLAVLGDDIALEIGDLAMKFRGQPTTVPLNLRLRVGSICAVVGPNGAGKSSMLSALAQRGVPEVALVPEDARELFARTTVREELDFADKLCRVESGLTALTFASILGGGDPARIEGLLELHPRDLSTGTQRALAIALQLSHKPRAILIDEPTRGLDPLARENMTEVLRCVAETGTVVMFATHDAEFASHLDAQQIALHEGQLVPSLRDRVGGVA